MLHLLPTEIQRLVYEYDPTYRYKYNLVMLELELIASVVDSVVDWVVEQKVLADFYVCGDVRVVIAHN